MLRLMPTEKILFLTGFLLLACLFDVRSRRIPNGLSAGVLMCGATLALLGHGLDGLWISAVGAFTAFAVMIPLYALRFMGAGDAKLMIALGTWSNASVIFATMIYTFLAGAVLAIGVMMVRGGWSSGYSNVRDLLHRVMLRLRGVPVQVVVSTENQTFRLPYALAIAAGVWLAHLRGPLF